MPMLREPTSRRGQFRRYHAPRLYTAPALAALYSQANARRSTPLPFDIAYSVCPHDCPSACALAVERLDGATIGRVRGAPRQSYTQGVVCAKVARYAERQHHPDRLAVPLRRAREKALGRDAFRPISWAHALDHAAD